MQHRMRLGCVSYFASCADDSMRQPRYSVDTDIRLHANVLVTASLLLVCFRIAFPVLVLRRWWRSDQRCIDGSALAYDQAYFLPGVR